MDYMKESVDEKINDFLQNRVEEKEDVNEL